ncbi:MAG TPA: hypothetical protein VGV59_03890 [Pyrinomonadaceae bacterium]|nr:hypothetical protein [Pyrinomonadaceae bacterium]
MNGSTDNSERAESINQPTEKEVWALDACPACGAARRRSSARFCATCGRELNAGGYLPLDAIRASYHLQNSRTGSAMRDMAAARLPHAAASSSMTASTVATAPSRRESRRKQQRAMPFTKNNNSASTTALAFVTYALVPYLGILFCPGALVLGGIGLARARRAPHDGGRRASVMSISMGLLLLGVQLLLWWILYKVPEWSRQSF